MVLEKRLAAPIIILLYGEKKKNKLSGLFVFLITGHSCRGPCKSQDAAVVPLKNSVSGEFYLLEHLHVVRRALALKRPCKSKGNSCEFVYIHTVSN